MESIFLTVFDNAEPQLQARWLALKRSLGLPCHVDQVTIERVAAFADEELGALVLYGEAGLNTRLPPTENQKTRQSQSKPCTWWGSWRLMREEEEKEMAAAQATTCQSQSGEVQRVRLTMSEAMARVEAYRDAGVPLPLPGNSAPSMLPSTVEGEMARAGAAQAQLVAQATQQSSSSTSEPLPQAERVRVSATTSIWAKPCRDWVNRGICAKGINCPFAHAGFPVTECRCVTCGRNNHMSKECFAPGGNADPNSDVVWAEYRKRKEANPPPRGWKNSHGYHNPPPSGWKNSYGSHSRLPVEMTFGKGQSKASAGNVKGAGKQKSRLEEETDKDGGVRAVVDAETTKALAAQGLPPAFPRNAIGLDSWANVHLIHQKHSKKTREYEHSLTLAHGTCKGFREVGRKGVPRVYVPWVTGGENIDLFPEGFLWDRGCSIIRGKEHMLETPKGRVVSIKMWGSLPYILKDDLRRVIDDLPDDEQLGRTGHCAQAPTAARVCTCIGAIVGKATVKVMPKVNSCIATTAGVYSLVETEDKAKVALKEQLVIQQGNVQTKPCPVTCELQGPRCEGPCDNILGHSQDEGHFCGTCNPWEGQILTEAEQLLSDETSKKVLTLIVSFKVMGHHITVTLRVQGDMTIFVQEMGGEQQFRLNTLKGRVNVV